jgi:uncharacterized protein (DUF169 family)
MEPLSTDLSIFKKFNFKNQPVGVKFEYGRPKDIKELDEKHPLCEMFKVAQQKDHAFYFTKENENCVGRLIMGMETYPAYVQSGVLGPKYGIFKTTTANKKIYEYIPTFDKGTVNYVVFAKLDKISFEPDLLVTMGTPEQAEIILRSMSWSTGVPWEAKATSPLGCSWVYAYPIKSGKVNYSITGLAFGMKAKHIFESGQVVISIPFNWISTITRNLNQMVWELPSYTEGREAFEKRELQLMAEFAEEYKDEVSSAGTDIYKKR